MVDYDPTKIEINTDWTDPTQVLFEGVAVHGNTPFSCPYLTHITGTLYTGGCTNGLVLPENIRHVISLYPWEQYKYHNAVKTTLSVRMYDADPQESKDIHRIAEWAVECLEDDDTLIHCQAGLNRSGLISALALIKMGKDPQEAIDLLREKRSPAVLCNRGFENWLLSL